MYKAILKTHPKKIDPNLAIAHVNMSLMLLLSGNFEQGWKKCEWRTKLKDFPRRQFSQPMWDGSDITGKTILLHAEQAKNPSKGMKLIDYTEDIHDFSDTAAFIENLDLIISVDTAAAHLAGALGKPVWTLLPFVPDWRWLLNRDDSPWYPTMRLFRQPAPGDWESVVGMVSDKLQKITERKT